MNPSSRRRKKKWISDDTYAVIREKREAKGKDKNKAREHQQPFYMCFVDFKKALDSISCDKLWVTTMDVDSALD